MHEKFEKIFKKIKTSGHILTVLEFRADLALT
jgi:hypothetical protein